MTATYTQDEARLLALTTEELLMEFETLGGQTTREDILVAHLRGIMQEADALRALAEGAA